MACAERLGHIIDQRPAAVDALGVAVGEIDRVALIGTVSAALVGQIGGSIQHGGNQLAGTGLVKIGVAGVIPINAIAGIRPPAAG